MSDTNISFCGSSLFLSLPSDVLSLISTRLRPSDLLSLSLSCRRLHRHLLLSSDSDPSIWLPQCLNLFPSLPPSSSTSSSSYLSICRFLLSVSPLLGLWVHQNPELGNLVSVSLSPADLSLLASRVIPQQLSPSGTLLFAPVFHILPPHEDGGSNLRFFLYGRGGGMDRCDDQDSLYPGTVTSIDRNCNVLLLEVDVGGEGNSGERFGMLTFGDRRRLLDAVASKVRVRFEEKDDVSIFGSEDRMLGLVQLHEVSGGGRIDWKAAEILGAIERSRGNGRGGGGSGNDGNGKKRSLFSVVKQIIGRSNSSSSSSSSNGAGSCNSSSESKHASLGEFLKGGEMMSLSLRATNMRLTTYRAWPNMHNNIFALYKLPLQEPTVGREYAGLWGGTFGWPPGKLSADKPGKALFFLLLSYEEIDGHLLLIATKILEGTHYVLHPNGSAMFTVKVDEPALDLFPWETDGDDGVVEIKRSYAGEGIANGYGFRYPGSKPGSLFEMQNGHLAFVWKESTAVLTLQRFNVEELLKKGERVPALPPIANFAYLTKSYSNVFAGFPGNSSCSPSPRCDFLLLLTSIIRCHQACFRFYDCNAAEDLALCRLQYISGAMCLFVVFGNFI